MHSCIGKVGISHPVCRRFHCGPQILSSHSHPDRTESTFGLRKKQLAQEGDTFSALQAKRAGTGALFLCFASAQSICWPGAITLTCWGNTMDHQLDVPVHLSHRAGRVHTAARDCVQRGTRALEK